MICRFQVRFVDQQKINEFGKLNNRLLEIRADLVQLKADIEKLDDASAELMMNTGKVFLFMGESFIETDEDYANECKFLFSSFLIALFLNPSISFSILCSMLIRLPKEAGGKHNHWIKQTFCNLINCRTVFASES